LIVPLGRDAIQQTFTPHFWASVFKEGEELTEPTITPATLQTLVDSQLWREDHHVTEFILEHYQNFTEEERQQFGSAEFWEYVADHVQ